MTEMVEEMASELTEMKEMIPEEGSVLL